VVGPEADGGIAHQSTLVAAYEGNPPVTVLGQVSHRLANPALVIHRYRGAGFARAAEHYGIALRDKTLDVSRGGFREEGADNHEPIGIPGPYGDEIRLGQRYGPGRSADV